MIVLDRFEGNFAVIEEDGIIKNIPIVMSNIFDMPNLLN